MSSSSSSDEFEEGEDQRPRSSSSADEAEEAFDDEDPRMRYSIVEFFGEDAGHACGYCKKKDGSINSGLWAHSLSPGDYQEMIDRGWRRSGKYCYKPTMRKTCCPLYTIRCSAVDFKPTKSHKRVLKRFRHFLENGKEISDKVEEKESGEAQENGESENARMANHIESMGDRVKAGEAGSVVQPSSAGQVITKTGEQKSVPPKLSKEESKVEEEKVSTKAVKEIQERSGGRDVKMSQGADPEKPKARKAKDIRKERALAKSSAKNDEPKPKATKSNGGEKSLDDFVSEFFEDVDSSSPKRKHKFELRLVKAQRKLRSFERTFKETTVVYKKYQMKIHGDTEKECTERQFTRFLCDSSLQYKRIPTSSTVATELTGYNLPTGYGGYHQQYLIDGNIIAVGVVDILPDCISSVYFLYDPDYSFLSLGTLSSLVELWYTKKISQIYSQINKYYMGFYIHTCPKMRYKAQYHPSFLLCPESLAWVPVQGAQKTLDVEKYSKLHPTQPSTGFDSIERDPVMILYNGSPMPFAVFKQIKGHITESQTEEVNEFARLIGHKVAYKTMLLFRQ